MSDDKTKGMKSAYELALERLQARGIEPPREGSLSDAVREQIAEARRRAEAKLAEVEILFHDRRQGGADPAEQEQAEAEYRHERRRIEDDRDRAIARLREASSSR